MKFSLGTAQFGEAYGITSTCRMLSDDEIFRIIDIFVASGNTFIDTAQGYGNAHKKIAQWLKKNFSISECKLNVTSKICIKNNADINLFRSNVMKICEEIGLDKLYSILIHNPLDVLNLEHCLELNEEFRMLRKDGFVEKIGVSVYDPVEFFNIYREISEIDIIQSPINILDQRFLQQDIQKVCKQKNIEIHARSLFLQGALLCEKLPPKIVNNETISLLQKFQEEIKNTKFGALEVCCMFMQQNSDAIDKWVLGFNTHHELKEFLLQADQSKKYSDISFNQFVKDNKYIDPRTWDCRPSC